MSDQYGNASQPPQNPNVPPPPPGGQHSAPGQPPQAGPPPPPGQPPQPGQQPGGYQPQSAGQPPPPQGYQPPAAGYGAGGPGSPQWTQGYGPQDEGNFFSNLFDFNFTRFVTPSVVKILYVLLLVLLGLTYLTWVIAGFSEGFGWGLLALIGGALISLVTLILYRVGLEVLVAVIQVAKNTGQLAERR